MSAAGEALRVRWLGQVRYRDALALQHALFASSHDHLLLLEHPHVFTLGARADLTHVLVDPASVGADLVEADRGGDVTYHGPGQLVGYPILDVAGKLKTPVIGFYAGKDGHIPVSHVELLKKELATGKSGSEVNVYADGDHGFNADYRPMYNKAAAEDAWKKMIAWFKLNL